MSAERRKHPASTRTISTILITVAAIAATVMGLVGWTLWSARAEALASATNAAENVALTVSRVIESGIGFYSRSLAATAATLSGRPSEPAQVGQRQPDMFPGMAATAGLGAIVVIDAAGRIVARLHDAAPVDEDFAGREFVRLQQKRPDAGLDISVPFRFGADAVWCVALSVKLFRPDGAFDGIVLAILPIAYFLDLTRALNVGHLGAVSLLRQDGILIARTPSDEGLIGRDIRRSPLFTEIGAAMRGGGHGVAIRDGTNRIYSYSRVAGVPLVVTVAISSDEIYAAWRLQAIVVAAITVLLLVVLLGGAMALRREFIRRMRADAAADASAASYRLLAENSSDIILRIDRAGVQRYVSPSIEELLGYDPADLTGLNWRMLATPEDRPILDDATAKLRDGSDRATVEYRCRHRAGHVLWVEASLRLVRDPAGGFSGDVFRRPSCRLRADRQGAAAEPDGAIVNIRDVTWRKQAEDELAAAAGQLAILASTDGLTALANRRSFDETLLREWRRARRGSTHLGLLLLDADWFKAYNDQYGHQKGDDALRAIASCISDTIKRPGDLGARYGGEEFAVILPGSNEAGVMKVAEDIRARLAALALPHAGTPTAQLTISIGIAALVVLTDRDPADLVAAADAALYAAKRGGRDRIVVLPVPTLALAAN